MGIYIQPQRGIDPVMSLISIYDVQIDSILAEPVVDRDGRVILAAGTPLSPVILKRLELWSIPRVAVESDSARANKTGDKKRPEKRRKREKPSTDASPERAPTPAPPAPTTHPWTAEFGRHRDNPQMVLIERALNQWAQHDRGAS